MAWVLVKGIALAGTGLKALGKVAHFSGLLDTFSSSSKNVTLFKLGDWIRLKVGGESYVTKKKTLARIPDTLFFHLLEADKLIDIPKIQMWKMRLLNQMHITVTPSTGKIKFGPKKKDIDKEKEKSQEMQEKKKERDEEKEKEKEKEDEDDDDDDVVELDPDNPQDTAKAVSKEHKERFEKDQDGFWMIDRDPTHFPAILNYLRTGIVTTEEEELDELLVEAQFYQIQPLVDYIEETLLEIRRKKERKSVLEHDLKGFDKDKPFFAVSYHWIELWKEFIYNDGKPPPPIDNTPLVNRGDNIPLKDKKEEEDFVFVNSNVWMTWWLIYGGGPIIARNSPDLYSSNVLSTLWHMTIGNEKDTVVCEPSKERGEEGEKGMKISEKEEEEEKENEKGPIVGEPAESTREKEQMPTGVAEKAQLDSTTGKRVEDSRVPRRVERTRKREEVKGSRKTKEREEEKKEEKAEKVPEEAKITHDSKIIEETEHLKQTKTPQYVKVPPSRKK